MKRLAILGCRGIPAQHGGFETFAEHLALYLTAGGWQVTVYCQDDGGLSWRESVWQGVRLVNVPIRRSGAAGTIEFDWRSIGHALAERSPVLTLGYNTALFSLRHRLHGVPHVINMDGIEWRRAKWSFPQRAWLYLNERAGCLLGNHLIADHPEIAAHLATRVAASKITMIPYGADAVLEPDAPPFGLEPGSYALAIARPEPENSLLEMVKAFSRRERGRKLVLLGGYDPVNPYHRAVLSAASPEVCFPGPLYEARQVAALRFHSRVYLHGHTVGGTNPSLVESLAAGSPVLAHDNRFNRWVAGEGARYFREEVSCGDELDALLEDDALLRNMRESSLVRHRERFTWERILGDYERLLEEELNGVARGR